MQILMNDIRDRAIDLMAAGDFKRSGELSEKFTTLFMHTSGKYEERIEGFKKLLNEYPL